MLVITRRIGQSLVIDGKIEVMVTEIGRDGVRLGISAPRDVEIHRMEVFQAIAEANRDATGQGHPLQDAADLLRERLAQGRGPKADKK